VKTSASLMKQRGPWMPTLCGVSSDINIRQVILQ